MDTIHSTGNPIYKDALKLAGSRRERLRSGRVLLSGDHLVDAAHTAGWTFERLLVREGTALPDAPLRSATASVSVLAPALFDAVEAMPSATGLLAIVQRPEPEALRTDGRCMLLDGIQDPGNVGTILRTAAAAGVDQVWLGTGCADVWSPKVLRAAMGAHFTVPLVERVDGVAAMSAFRGQRLITALDGAADLYDCDLRGSLLLAFGAEGQGVSEAVAALAGLRVKIPMAPGVESLNVGAAAAVCLFEMRRQQLRAARNDA